MKLRFDLDIYRREKALTIEMQMLHNEDLRQIYTSAYKLDISEPIELACFNMILKEMENNTAKLAIDKLNLMQIREYRHIRYLEARIRDLESMLMSTSTSFIVNFQDNK